MARGRGGSGIPAGTARALGARWQVGAGDPADRSCGTKGAVSPNSCLPVQQPGPARGAPLQQPLRLFPNLCELLGWSTFLSPSASGLRPSPGLLLAFDFMQRAVAPDFEAVTSTCFTRTPVPWPCLA